MALNLKLNCAWDQLIKDNVIDEVEDPILESPTEIKSFEEIYGKFLSELDGQDEESRVSYFFEVSIFNNRTLIFKDKQKRKDFRKESEIMNLIPKLKEICEGETKKEKLQRKKSESMREICDGWVFGNIEGDKPKLERNKSDGVLITSKKSKKKKPKSKICKD